MLVSQANPWEETPNDVINNGSSQIMEHQERFEFIKGRDYSHMKPITPISAKQIISMTPEIIDALKAEVQDLEIRLEEKKSELILWQRLSINMADATEKKVEKEPIQMQLIEDRNNTVWKKLLSLRERFPHLQALLSRRVKDSKSSPNRRLIRPELLDEYPVSLMALVAILISISPRPITSRELTMEIFGREFYNQGSNTVSATLTLLRNQGVIVSVGAARGSGSNNCTAYATLYTIKGRESAH